MTNPSIVGQDTHPGSVLYIWRNVESVAKPTILRQCRSLQGQLGNHWGKKVTNDVHQEDKTSMTKQEDHDQSWHRAIVTVQWEDGGGAVDTL